MDPRAGECSKNTLFPNFFSSWAAFFLMKAGMWPWVMPSLRAICVDCSDFLHVVREQFPELFNYAAAAYGHESLLQFADAFLASRAGVHQGDPLGPLFFALALVVILQSIDTDALELNAWYLDDGTVGATTLAIRAFLNSLAQVAREHDLTLNFSKCEIVCADADVALFRNEFPEITSIVPVSSFFNAKKVTVSVLYWQPNIATRSCAVGDICAACRKINLPHLLLLLGLGPRPPSSSSRPCALQWRAVPPGGSCLGGRDFGRPPSSGSSPAPVSRPASCRHPRR
jgi:hypothetical protein